MSAKKKSDKAAYGGSPGMTCSFSARVRPTINANTGERRWAVQVWNGKQWVLGVAREDGPQPAQKLRFRLRREANETAAWINANPHPPV